MPGAAGDFASIGWPGVAGVLQAIAPRRFAACLNQAPERQGRWGRLADWASGRRRFLSSRATPPAHLLRKVLETAPTYDDARSLLAETPIAAPVIYILAGPAARQGCVIERLEEDAAIRDLADGPAVAANHFASLPLDPSEWRDRGYDSIGRAACAAALSTTPEIDNLAPPLLNPFTRLAVRLDPAGVLSATGYDASGPVTRTLRLDLDDIAQEPVADR